MHFYQIDLREWPAREGDYAVMCEHLYTGARVALSKHHEPTQEFAFLGSVLGSTTKSVEFNWEPPTNVHKKLFQPNEATEKGAECIAIGYVEAEADLRLIGRAEKASGCDWLVSPTRSTSPIEDVMALEVSGIDAAKPGNTGRIRLIEKKNQIRNGLRRGMLLYDSYAAIVVFKQKEVYLGFVKGPSDFEA